MQQSEKEPNLDYLPNPERPAFSTPQELWFGLIEQSSHDDFDGKWVVETLRGNPGIWEAAMIGNFGQSGELVGLRDMRQGFFNADTLAVLTTREHEPAVEEMLHILDADEIHWLTRRQTEQALGMQPAKGKRVALARWS